MSSIKAALYNLSEVHQDMLRKTSLGQHLRSFYSSVYYFETTLLEKQSKFPRYHMKCRGKPDTT